MHILILPSWYPTKNNNIAGIFFKEQAEALSKHKINIGCISINESSPKFLFDNKHICFDYFNLNIKGVNTIGIMYPIIYRMKLLRKFILKIIFKFLFKKYIKQYGLPDIIHLHSFVHGDLVLWVKKEYNIDYIVTEHSSGFYRDVYNSNELDLASVTFKHSKYNISVSKEFTKLLTSKFKFKFNYIPNIIDTNYFVPKIKDNEEFVFINVAFLNENKNHEMLIKSFHKSFYGLNKVKLIIVGSGEEYNSLKILIKELNLITQVTLFGLANRSDIKKLLQDSNAFVLSSIYETFGVVLIEAMSCGLPVVSTKCGGPESIINNKQLGILCENNLEDLSGAMKKVYEKEYDSLYIRKYIIDNFSEDQICKKLIAIYKGIK